MAISRSMLICYYLYIFFVIFAWNTHVGIQGTEKVASLPLIVVILMVREGIHQVTRKEY